MENDKKKNIDALPREKAKHEKNGRKRKRV